MIMHFTDFDYAIKKLIFYNLFYQFVLNSTWRTVLIVPLELST